MAEAQIITVKWLHCSISGGGGKEIWVVYHMLSHCHQKPIDIFIWCTLLSTLIIGANSKNPNLIVNCHVHGKKKGLVFRNCKINYLLDVNI